ncbi:hypothetical protein ALI144C_38880 [Actinosynnema sp. ALI-1.44]|uniref:DUF6879 family protein n=1 Tax=Actinosynnema sp. ALI-1.44 TaxID=1933779 RepID=UPI00097C113A|nr:DUF6879 family protein [Actinosynnema sp. ALI-1.44]ONI74772.1 hypothetical protein ALI144C_38880 [Actinosynnema sp. ALI-1.44]
MSKIIDPGAAFRQLFSEFEHTAFRLEVRNAYAVERERKYLDRFLAGAPEDVSWLAGWFDTVRTATEAGRRFMRVRVVDLPLSDYSRFGYVHARYNNDAGEDIRYLHREAARDVGLPNHDYWLFDSRRLLRMNFDDEDRLLNCEFDEDPIEIVRHNYWRDVAWHHAVKRDEFVTEEQLGRA